jgi:hypothetical protein
MKYKRGDLVIYKDELYKVYGDLKLSGLIRIREAKRNGTYRRVPISKITPCSGLIKELL